MVILHSLSGINITPQCGRSIENVKELGMPTSAFKNTIKKQIHQDSAKPTQFFSILM